MTTSDHDVKIAVLTNEVQGIREQQKAHAQETSAKLDTIILTQSNMNNWLQQNSTIPAKVDELWNNHQKQKGFFTASKAGIAMVGGIIVWGINKAVEFIK